MWFTRSADGFRGWLIVEALGALVPGLISSDFSLSVIAPGDAASTAPTVNESSQRPGVYYFDVPSSFLLANGVGSYFVVAEINTESVSASTGALLHVSLDCFDSLAASVAALDGAGLTPTQATMLLELYQLMGLDPTKPLLVSPTARKVPADGAIIDQSIVSAGDTVTVQRQ